VFDKILIANRGEIACRVMRTARALGVRTVAVYSDADAAAMHVELADEAHHIGPAAAGESYLRGDRILEVARRSGAEAIHPGYGFLSENAGFAERCAEAGVAFIGPPASAIRAMGSKSAALGLMEEAGVPVLPGYHGEEQDPETLRAAAGRIGYPVIIKPSAGGGGKGMRIVRDAGELDSALGASRREARGAFGDETVLIERYLTRPRHIEVQVFADTHGDVVYLFERDCSIQRRHQKILEEAPAPGMADALRARMGRAAVDAARAIGYTGAGTVEFLFDADDEAGADEFFFMEMNTRLQVEHPVTEAITGQDLVEWQIRVASGAPLPRTQDQLSIRGHAIEARVYAEDPENDFLPATGRLRHLRPPEEGPHVRVDTGVREGDSVSIHYDPMIAKLVVWDHDRGDALRRLRRALADYEIAGLSTNVAFLTRAVAHPEYVRGRLDTGFIERHRSELFPPARRAGDDVLAFACLQVLLAQAARWRARARDGADPYSPWNDTHGWRLNDETHHVLTFVDREQRVPVKVHYRPRGYLMELPSGERLVDGALGPRDTLRADLAGRRAEATVIRQGTEITVIVEGVSHTLVYDDPDVRTAGREAAEGKLTAPMPGKVVSVLVEAGEQVARGAALMVLEAMKMEHTITAPADGVVDRVRYSAGDQVDEGAELLSLAPAQTEAGPGDSGEPAN